MRFPAVRGLRSSALVAAASLVAAGLAAAVAPPAQAQPDPLHRFEDQAIAWHDCRTNPDDPFGARLAASGVQCGELTVPLDYRHPDGRTLSVAVDRRAATNSAHRLGTLFVTVGGIGGARTGIPLIVQNPASAPLAARYDLVALDPRFFGLSEPLNCGWPHNVTARYGDTATPDRASFDTSVTEARQLAALCGQHADVLPFGSTRNIARDMDLLRSALGQQRISYLAWSYGTYLGAVYLQLFGQHLDRVVFDSTFDPNAGGQVSHDHEAASAEADLVHWAGWAASRDGQYHLGATTPAVLNTISAIVAGARRQPLRVGDFTVDANLLPGMLSVQDDSDPYYAGFSGDVAILRDAARGLAVTPSAGMAAFLSGLSDPTVSPTNHASAGTALNCADHAAVRDPEFYYRDIQAHLATEPLYGPLVRIVDLCAFWPIDPIEPSTIVDSHHPLLMVGGVGDPIIPFGDQLVAHRVLSGSRLVTLDDSFHHAQYLFSNNACVDDTVQSYLLGGPLPSHDLTCHTG